MSKLPPIDITEEDGAWAFANDPGYHLVKESLHCRERQLEDALTRLEKAEELLQNMVDTINCNRPTQYDLCSTCKLSVFNAKAFLEAEQ
jgi:hypothetical protein